MKVVTQTPREKFFNNKYLSLCQQLGDAQIKYDQITSLIEKLKKEIEELNSGFKLMESFEKTQGTPNE